MSGQFIVPNGYNPDRAFQQALNDLRQTQRDDNETPGLSNVLVWVLSGGANVITSIAKAKSGLDFNIMSKKQMELIRDLLDKQTELTKV